MQDSPTSFIIIDKMNSPISCLHPAIFTPFPTSMTFKQILGDPYLNPIRQGHGGATVHTWGHEINTPPLPTSRGYLKKWLTLYLSLSLVVRSWLELQNCSSGPFFPWFSNSNLCFSWASVPFGFWEKKYICVWVNHWVYVGRSVQNSCVWPLCQESTERIEKKL